MFRRARELMTRGFGTMAAADKLMDRGDAMMAKGEAMLGVLDKVMAAVGADVEDFIKELQDGVDVQLVWGKFEKQEDGGTVLPLRIRVVVKE